MTDDTIQIQPKTEQARSRLDKAVARLEDALDKVGQVGQVSKSETGSAAKLESLVEENIRLKDLNESVSGRLDNAINRLSQVLEGA